MLAACLITPQFLVADDKVSQETMTSIAAKHETHCAACHINITDGDGSVIYTRSDRLAKNEAELRDWVAHFSNGLQLNWSDPEIAAMTQYIKENYYQANQVK